MQPFMFFTVLLGYILGSVTGHGRLRLPPGRSSAWRDGYPVPKNYQDNELNCGGRYTQWDLLNGECGVCGDPVNAEVQQNQPPGKYALQVIVDCVAPNTYIKSRVELTANHRGYIEYRLCPQNDFGAAVTQECLDQNLLEIRDLNPDGSPGKSYGTRYMVTATDEILSFSVVLPRDMTCTQCVIQWRYVAGNNWGCDTDNGVRRCGIGMGGQESFYNCADIAVLNDCSQVSEYMKKGRVSLPVGYFTDKVAENRPIVQTYYDDGEGQGLAAWADDRLKNGKSKAQSSSPEAQASQSPQRNNESLTPAPQNNVIAERKQPAPTYENNENSTKNAPTPIPKMPTLAPRRNGIPGRTEPTPDPQINGIPGTKTSRNGIPGTKTSTSDPQRKAPTPDPQINGMPGTTTSTSDPQRKAPTPDPGTKTPTPDPQSKAPTPDPQINGIPGTKTSTSDPQSKAPTPDPQRNGIPGTRESTPGSQAAVPSLPSRRPVLRPTASARGRCLGVGIWSGVLDLWCARHCVLGFCPPSICGCR